MSGVQNALDDSVASFEPLKNQDAEGIKMIGEIRVAKRWMTVMEVDWGLEETGSATHSEVDIALPFISRALVTAHPKCSEVLLTNTLLAGFLKSWKTSVAGRDTVDDLCGRGAVSEGWASSAT